ncbi:hypothetical protein NVP1248O_49 [Vibrio phage 1.248.O._10N.261.54.F1]|nr:hypothetical protein NVP1248O_49 [Vibrio phage 1.248.O._10N.261.54.F1]
MKNKITNIHQKKGMPEYGKKVMLYGSDCFGEWKVKGELKPFKKPPHKKSPIHRFVSEKGDRIHYVEFWSDL